jgi:5-deoxy-glucuronate isomerase
MSGPKSSAEGSSGHHLPAGTTGSGAYVLDIDPARAGWTYSGLRVLELAPGQSATVDTGPAETLVLSLTCDCVVDCPRQQVALAGRSSVFTGVSDVVYLPRDTRARVHSEHGGRFALPSAVCERRLEVQHLPAASVQVELRGAGRSSRQVNNLGTPDVLDADRIIACEVLTPAGNWSSYPPHNHDQEREGESVLEEIYYFEVGDGPAGPGIGYQRVYTRPDTHPDRSLDLLAEVRTGDVVTMPFGWHGPSMAVPGYDLYYLNVMAGPGERAWRICDDPLHAWVRDTWEHEETDPRLPFSAAPLPAREGSVVGSLQEASDVGLAAEGGRR